MIRSTRELRCVDGDAASVIASVRADRRAVIRCQGGHHKQPRTALAAIDFSPASIDAARLIHRLVADDGTLYLLHVLTPAGMADGFDMGDVDGQSGHTTREAFDSLEAQLVSSKPVRKVEVWRAGSAADEVVDFARSNRVDMIAIGCSGFSSAHRNCTAAETLLNATSLPVLIVPARNRLPSPNLFDERSRLSSGNTPGFHEWPSQRR